MTSWRDLVGNACFETCRAWPSTNTEHRRRLPFLSWWSMLELFRSWLHAPLTLFGTLSREVFNTLWMQLSTSSFSSLSLKSGKQFRKLMFSISNLDESYSSQSDRVNRVIKIKVCDWKQNCFHHPRVSDKRSSHIGKTCIVRSRICVHSNQPLTHDT